MRAATDCRSGGSAAEVVARALRARARGSCRRAHVWAGACNCGALTKPPRSPPKRDDPFELVDLEASLIEEGRREGVANGRISGLQQGREIGVYKGFEIAQEVGFYLGCVRAWREAEAADANAFPARSSRGIAALEGLLAKFPVGDPTDESLTDVLDDLRGKFKAVTASMDKQAEYAAMVQKLFGGGASGTQPSNLAGASEHDQAQPGSQGLDF